MGYKFLKVFFALLCLILLGFFAFYGLLFKDNIIDNEINKNHEFFISTGANYQDVLKNIQENQILLNKKSFDILSKRLKYDQLIKPGRFLIPNNMNNWDLIHKLRSGDQDAVRVTINNITYIDDLIGKVAKKLEFDSIELANTIYSDSFLNTHNLNKDNLISYFISNTYEIWWNTSVTSFLSKMDKEHKKFWNIVRLEQARKLNLSPEQVTTLASIVQKESNKKDEHKRIAGVYINRLNDNWPLQADPTVKFALRQLDLKRILTVHTQFDSPFNTYRNIGLPPGPICLPEIFAIDGVLNTEKHSYFFFCAKEDFSGYHNFATTLAEHNSNATKYQQALNQRGIK